MELHSYAKRRASKKWTIEQKRKLVEARIALDGIFSKRPTTCLTTWKKIVSLAKLDDYNVSFVRKQWSNMVAKYKQYKKSRLGNMTGNDIDDEMLRKVSQEWEFFQPIHCFMSRRVTNLHSYALTQGQKQRQTTSNVLTQQQQQEQDVNNASLASQLETMLANNNSSSPEIKPGQGFSIFSSGTNDDYAAAETIPSDTHNVIGTLECSEAEDKNDPLWNMQIQNTDHDFYSKKSPKQNNYLEDEEEAALTNVIKIEANYKKQNIKGEEAMNLKPTASEQQCIVTLVDSNNCEKVQTKENHRQDNEASGSKFYFNISENTSEVEDPEHNIGSRKKYKMSERDKYYRHKRRFNRRLERRFDSLLNVFGQIVKAEYPNINVHPLFGVTAQMGLLFKGSDNINGKNHGGFPSSSDESTDPEMSSSIDDRMESQAESTVEE